MNNDIATFVNYINGSNPTNSKKRMSNKLSIKEFFINTKIIVIDRLGQSSNSELKLKGRKLTKYIEGIKQTMRHFITGLKTGKQIEKQISELLRLLLIAESSITINLLDEIIQEAVKDKNKTYIFFIKNINKNLVKLNKNPNKKIKKSDKSNNYPQQREYVEEDSTDEDYAEEYSIDEESNSDGESLLDEGSDDEGSLEEDSDDEDSVDKDSVDEDSVDKDSVDKKSVDKDYRGKLSKYDKKEGLDFISQIFKNREGDTQDMVLNYYSKLSTNKKTEAVSNIKLITNYQYSDKPILFQIMELPLQISQKNYILKNYTELTTSPQPDAKHKSWFDSLMTIPFGQYTGINLPDIEATKVKQFIDTLQESMDKSVYGHDECKRQIIQTMAQQIRNPKAKGNMIGIWGPPGNGKTSLIKEGIAKAMNKPFIFISLGGATDSSFLEGHSYTYEGSIYGRIANGLITSKCMDPIIYFDELDKISNTAKGEEITNLLVHLTDPAQNSHFRDKYFHGVDIDLSRATMIFSFNDPHSVNHILMDRITTIETKYLIISQKVHIAQNYLLAEMMKDMGLESNGINMSDETCRYIINTFTNEGGIRKLKSILYNICREINLSNLINGTIHDQPVIFPFTIEQSYLKTLLKYKRVIEHDKVEFNDKPGIINGLWANTLGQGGILSIESVLYPSSSKLAIKATGHLKKVIKESIEVATSLSWNYITEERKIKLLSDWKDAPMGIHIHCPDGSTPKDGPSAGAAITLAIYSLLTGKKIKYDIAMTGEINLEGNITAIGGLEEKLEGAKRAGVKLVLYPLQNQKDIDKIKERNNMLIDDNFKVIPIKSFDEVIKLAII